MDPQTAFVPYPGFQLIRRMCMLVSIISWADHCLSCITTFHHDIVFPIELSARNPVQEGVQEATADFMDNSGFRVWR